MNGSAKIGTALVGGYLLGRTKKAKLAIGLGMFLAGKKMPLDPKQLGRMLADSPLLGTLNDQVRKELVGATKTAATQALTQRATGLADSLQRRTRELEAPQGEDAGDEEDEDPGEEDEHRDAGAGEPDDERPAPRKKAAAKAPAKSTAGTAGRGGTRRSPSGGAGKKTASTTRKTTSGARKTAAGTRKSRGGDRG
ncbi:hypothetical protein [Streptomyces sp. NRRL WC-3549]|uniref:hypothetical protein n=1 Tax=Streptomyces sp. NRRL WC-3549 TaxID=1463925 RepID=UPI0004C5B8E1|nr:hypothetical protein [Streptomyces sp. NRRL WC-3549]